MRIGLAKPSPRARIVGGVIVVVALVYLLLISVFGRPLGIISFDTTAELVTGAEVVSPRAGWDQLYLSELIGVSLDEAMRTLGTPGVDNTLAPKDQGGLTVVVDGAPAKTRPAGDMAVIGYCVTMELADRHFLTLAVADFANLDAAARAAIAEEPQQVAYRYQSAHKCDGESIGQFTPWLDVRPQAHR